MLIEMTTSVMGDLYAYNEGTIVDAPDDRAKELITLGRAVPVSPPAEAAVTETPLRPARSFQSRGPRREAR